MLIIRVPELRGFTYHCETGPVIEWQDGSYGWYLNDRRVKSYAEFQELTGCDDEYVILLKLKWGDIAKHVGPNEWGNVIC